MWFRPEPIHKHSECKNFELKESRCKYNKCIVNSHELSCKNFDGRVADTYQRFACAKCGLHGPQWKNIYIKTVYLDNGEDAWVFECCTCGAQTMVYQHQASQHCELFKARAQ